jgi:cytochrome c peroxidase
VFNTAQFWDGRASDLETQAAGPLLNPIEMGSSPGDIVERLKAIPGYVARFREAFPRQDDPITFEHVRRLIALFEATLITPDAPFDRYLRGVPRAGRPHHFRACPPADCVVRGDTHHARRAIRPLPPR